MSTQDHNFDRNSAIARKELIQSLLAPAGTDEDEIRYVFTPRYNFRVVDLALYAQAVATTLSRVRACIAKELSAVGAPQFGADTAVTFTIEAFTQLDAGVFTAVGATAAQAFGNTATVTDGFWGVWTIQIDGAQVITLKPASGPAGTMAFLTEDEAIKNAPTPDAANGLVGLLTLEASGGDFIAATTNTDAALVNAFNTIDRGGISADLLVLTTEQVIDADLAAAANTRLRVAKVGNLIGQVGDHVVVTIRSSGVSTITDGKATPSIRKFPLQGESGPDVATGLTVAQVP